MFQAKTELLMPDFPLTYYQYRTGMFSMMHSEAYSASSPSPETLPATITSAHLPLKKGYPHTLIRVEI